MIVAPLMRSVEGACARPLGGAASARIAVTSKPRIGVRCASWDLP